MNDIIPQYVTLPLEEYRELSDTAWGQTTTITDRVVGTVHTTILLASVTATIAAGAWTWAKATDWLEDRRFKRETELRTNKRS